jgi:hypothetical protein
METIEIQTLIDITNTKVARPNQGSQLELDQFRNFTTLKQCIEIRSIITYDFDPEVVNIDIKNLGFGTQYKGKNRVWTFRFHPDRKSVYVDETGNSVGGLINDLDKVPLIKNLTETINIDKAIFDCRELATKNTIIKVIKGII